MKYVRLAPCLNLFKCPLKLLDAWDADMHWLHLFLLLSSVHFQMCPQAVCPRACKITLVAFI